MIGSYFHIITSRGISSWTPLRISNLIEWWTIHDATTFTLNGAKQVTWTGKANSNVISQPASTDAKRLTYNGTEFIADGIDDFMTCSTVFDTIVNEPSFYSTMDPQNGPSVCPFGFQAANVNPRVFSDATNTYMQARASNTDGAIPIADFIGPFGVANWEFNGASSKYSINNGARNAADLGTDTFNILTVGARATETNHAGFGLREIVVCDGPVSDADHALLVAFMIAGGLA